jgi:hypothetical protein
MATRKAAHAWETQPTLEGAGVHLHRAFGFRQVPDLDPFLLLDDFSSYKERDYIAGFPWHPHRGIETITYMLAGRVEHGDSMGNGGVIGAGDIQWMTAGSGIIHQEMPKGPGLMSGFQLWANLPANYKMMDPRYRGLTTDEIPVAIPAEGITARVVCGEIGGVAGPVTDIVTDPSYMDITLDPGVEFTKEVPDGHTVFLYVFEGRAMIPLRDEKGFGHGTVVLFSNEGDEISFSAGDDGARFLMISGRPLGEPVAWYGPIVMNTEEELRQAFDEYENGTFLKQGSNPRDA